MLALLGRGRPNREIVRQLLFSPATVKTRVNRSMKKLDVRDRAQWGVIARESGLARPGEARRPAKT